MSEKIIIVQAKCIHCDKSIVGPKDSFDEVWDNHLDSCGGFKAYMHVLKELHEKDMLRLVRTGQLEKSLKRLIKKYKSSPEELIEILEEFALGDKTVITLLYFLNTLGIDPR